MKSSLIIISALLIMTNAFGGIVPVGVPDFSQAIGKKHHAQQVAVTAKPKIATSGKVRQQHDRRITAR